MAKDGTLPITGDTQSGNYFPMNGLLDASNFALQFDFSDLRNSQRIGVHFRSYEFRFGGDNGWNLLEQKDAKMTAIASGYTGQDFQKNTTVLIMVYNKILKVFLNGTELYINTETGLSGTENKFVVFSDEPVIFDNIKFWNLDRMEINP